MSLGQLDNGDEPPKKSCPNCGERIPSQANFCPHCGTGLGTPHSPTTPRPPPRYEPLPPPTTLLDLGRGIASYVSLILLAFVAVNIGILLASVGTVSSELLSKKFSLFVVTPWLVDILELGGEALVGFFIFLVVAIVASFLWMIRKSLVKFTQELKMKCPSGGHSPLYLIATLFFSLLAFNFIYYIGLGAGGIDPSIPGFEDDVWKLIFAFANASVWEELITRVLFIGIPLLFVDLALKKSMRWKNYILGGGFELGRPEVIFLVFSSAMFALAHISSWDVYKMLPTFLAGLALGYLFLRVGLYAAIMLHFTVDFMSMPIEITQSLGVTLAIGVLTLAFIAIGSCYFFYYATRVFEFVLKKELWPPRILSPPPQPVMYRPIQEPGDLRRLENRTQQVRVGRPEEGFGFSCRFCGHTEARYKDGEFYCLRCGKKN